jgi:DNA-binding TFAR19-related protein (PDSD5 family)
MISLKHQVALAPELEEAVEAALLGLASTILKRITMQVTEETV